MEPVLTPEMIRAAAPEIMLPTPPGQREVALLERILELSDVDGVEVLREQVRGLLVSPGSDATARIYLVHHDAPRAPFSGTGRTKLPGQFLVRSPRGHLIGQLVLWIEVGHLRAMTYVRHDAQPTLTLPPPSWVEVPPVEDDADEAATDVPPAVRAVAAQASIAGLRTLDTRAQVTTTAPVAPAARRRTMRWTGIAAFLACVFALAAGVLIGARDNGPDIEAARAAGARAGAAAGTADATTLSTFAGSIEGELAGRASTYDAARKRAFFLARKQERARLDAELAKQTPNSSTCIGFRTAENTWVCTT